MDNKVLKALIDALLQLANALQGIIGGGKEAVLGGVPLPEGEPKRGRGRPRKNPEPEEVEEEETEDEEEEEKEEKVEKLELPDGLPKTLEKIKELGKDTIHKVLKKMGLESEMNLPDIKAGLEGILAAFGVGELTRSNSAKAIELLGIEKPGKSLEGKKKAIQDHFKKEEVEEEEVEEKEEKEEEEEEEKEVEKDEEDEEEEEEEEGDDEEDEEEDEEDEEKPKKRGKKAEKDDDDEEEVEEDEDGDAAADDEDGDKVEETSRLKAAKEWVEAQLEEGSLKVKEFKTHLAEYLKEKYLTHVKQETWPEYYRIRSFEKKSKFREAYEVYMSLFADVDGNIERDGSTFDNPYLVLSENGSVTSPFCNGVVMIKVEDEKIVKKAKLKKGEILAEDAVSGNNYALIISENTIESRKIDGK